MDRAKIKEKAKILRKQGKTYSEIRRDLGVAIPKSTLSDWCSAIQLPAEYYKKVDLLNLKNSEKGRAIAVAVNKQRRNEFLRNIKERNVYLLKKVDKDVLKMLLAMIYFCEGSSWKVHRGMALGNTDPELIKFYIFLLETCYPHIVTRDGLHCRIGCRADQDIQELQKFWSKTTDIPPHHFQKTKPDPRTVGKPTKKKDYKGVCVIFSRSTEIQIELETIARMFFKDLIKKGP